MVDWWLNDVGNILISTSPFQESIGTGPSQGRTNRTCVLGSWPGRPDKTMGLELEGPDLDSRQKVQTYSVGERRSGPSRKGHEHLGA